MLANVRQNQVIWTYFKGVLGFSPYPRPQDYLQVFGTMVNFALSIGQAGTDSPLRHFTQTKIISMIPKDQKTN